MSILLIVTAYLLGSIPTGLLLAKYAAGVDVRKRGSGNIGATNVLRSAGKGLGILTLLGDILKGLIPVIIAQKYFNDPFITGATALCAFLGHTFSIFLKFKGGKGVATAFGVFLAISWKVSIAAFLLFLTMVLIFRYVSLGSITGAALFPLLLFLIERMPVITVFSVIISIIIIIRHKDNIKRLLKNEESKIF